MTAKPMHSDVPQKPSDLIEPDAKAVLPAGQLTPHSDPLEPAGLDITSTVESAASNEKKKVNAKRAEPQNPFEFLEAFYAGRTKQLSESIVRRIKANGLFLDFESRGALVAVALSADENLDKTRKLMLLANAEEDLKPLGNLLIEFSAAVICLHPIIKTNGIQAKLFPNYLDESTLEDAWSALEFRKKVFIEAASVELNASPSQAVNDSIIDKKKMQKGLNKSKGLSKAVFTAENRAYRNAYLCSVIWRIHKKQATFSDSMRAMRNSIFRTPISMSKEGDLLEAIAQMPEKDDARAALLLDWQFRQQSDVTYKLAIATQQVDDLTVQLDAVILEKLQYINTVSFLQQDLVLEKSNNQQLQKDIGVAQTHSNVDLEKLRATSLQMIRVAIKNLETVTTALGRDPPKIEIATEVLNGVVDALTKDAVKLEGLI
jgi:hypothetical protein